MAATPDVYVAIAERPNECGICPLFSDLTVQNTGTAAMLFVMCMCMNDADVRTGPKRKPTRHRACGEQDQDLGAGFSRP
eukprot:955234-Prymnesium_polylepis.1